MQVIISLRHTGGADDHCYEKCFFLHGISPLWLPNNCHQRQEKASKAPLSTIRCMARLARLADPVTNIHPNSFDIFSGEVSAMHDDVAALL